MRFALIAAAAVMSVACSSQKSTNTPTSTVAVISSQKAVAATPYVTDVNEIRVRIDGDLGVDSVDRAFSARLVTPLMGHDGVVFAPAGSLVIGHVVSTSQHRVEIVFDRLETREGVYRIRANVVSAAPYALTVRPAESSPTVMLESAQPTAMGGGPVAAESEGTASVGEVVVPFDAELRLKLTEIVRIEH